MWEFLKKHKESITVFCIAIAVRFGFILYLILFFGIQRTADTFNPGSDSHYYLRMGSNMLHYGVYSGTSQPPFLPEQSIEPAYPVLLAGIFSVWESQFAVAIVQTILAGGIAVLLFWITRFHFSRRVAWGAVILFSLDPTGVYLSGAIFTDVLFLFFATLSLFFFLKPVDYPSPQNMLFAGMAMGVAALTRPEGQLLPLFLLLYYVITTPRRFWKSTIRTSFIFIIAFILVMSPLLIRNKLLFNSWRSSAIGIHKVYLYDLVYFYAHENNISYKQARQQLREKVIAISPYGTDAPLFNNTPYLERVTKEYILERPFSYARFYAIKTLPFFLTDGLRYVASKMGSVDVPTLNITQMIAGGHFGEFISHMKREELLSMVLFVIGASIWLTINTAMIFGVWKGVQSVSLGNVVVFFVGIILLFALISGTVSNARIRYKATPFIFILASFGCAEFYNWYHKRMKSMVI